MSVPSGLTKAGARRVAVLMLLLAIPLLSACRRPAESAEAAKPAARETVRARYPFSVQGYQIVVTETDIVAPEDYGNERVEIRVEEPGGRKAALRMKVEDWLTDAWCTDLDADGVPEIVLAGESAGSGSYGALWVVKVGPGGLRPLGMPDLTPELDQGYCGHDTFSRGGQRRIVRVFPVYRPDDCNAMPTGGERMVVYALREGRLVVAGSRDTPPAVPHGGE